MQFGLSLQIVKRMGNEIKKKAKSFLKEYGLQNVTLENLRSAIQKQGYTVVEYNNIFNDENVATLINALGLEDFCEHSKGFTYADTKRRKMTAQSFERDCASLCRKTIDFEVYRESYQRNFKRSL